MKYILLSLFLFIIFCQISFSQSKFFQKKMMHFYTCAERNVALNDLTQRLQYSRKALSITTTNEALELYMNSNNTEWLIMITGTNNITCGLIGGEQEFIFE